MENINSNKENLELKTILDLNNIPKSHYRCFSSADNFPVFYPSSAQIKQMRPLFIRLFRPTEKICWYFNKKSFLNIDQILPKQDTLNKPFSDPIDVSSIDFEDPQRASFYPHFFFNQNNKRYPLNPVGITGIHGKGILSYWGVNHKIELIVSRYKLNSQNQELEMIVMKNVDGKKILLPGLFDQQNRELSEQIVNAFADEICQNESNSVRNKLYQLLKSKSECVYQGYIDDPRNTDNAWIESSIFHVNCDLSFDDFTLENNNEFKWLSVSKCQNFYSDYSEVLTLVSQKLLAQVNAFKERINSHIKQKILLFPKPSEKKTLL